MKPEISKKAWPALALRLGVDEPTLKAVAAVESNGSGFVPPDDEEPKVLFEGHAFHRLTQGRYTAAHPTLSHKTWTKKNYAGSLKKEWDRLGRARALDRDAANQSASWGAFQIMGFNYGLCGDRIRPSDCGTVSQVPNRLSKLLKKVRISLRNLEDANHRRRVDALALVLHRLGDSQPCILAANIKETLDTRVP